MKTSELPERERELATRIMSGQSNAEIGEALSVSPDTIKTYVKPLFAKLGVRRRSKVATAMTRLE